MSLTDIQDHGDNDFKEKWDLGNSVAYNKAENERLRSLLEKHVSRMDMANGPEIVTRFGMPINEDEVKEPINIGSDANLYYAHFLVIKCTGTDLKEVMWLANRVL